MTETISLKKIRRSTSFGKPYGKVYFTKKDNPAETCNSPCSSRESYARKQTRYLALLLFFCLFLLLIGYSCVYKPYHKKNVVILEESLIVLSLHARLPQRCSRKPQLVHKGVFFTCRCLLSNSNVSHFIGSPSDVMFMMCRACLISTTSSLRVLVVSGLSLLSQA